MGFPAAYLVLTDVLLMWEVQSGHELVDVFALEPFVVKTFRHNLADEIFARPRPSVQRESQGFLRIRVCQKPRHGFHNHLGHQVLSEDFFPQIVFKICGRRGE